MSPHGIPSLRAMATCSANQACGLGDEAGEQVQLGGGVEAAHEAPVGELDDSPVEAGQRGQTARHGRGGVSACLKVASEALDVGAPHREQASGRAPRA